MFQIAVINTNFIRIYSDFKRPNFWRKAVYAKNSIVATLCPTEINGLPA
ncbi:hypothetical protein SAMN04488057_101154 [Cyclobacterium lianum]|uniref:Uncharacterized protein n=1 Tax=Cyclobacterium lianum TaxID=388280 RepID=A0A1M7I253_9BACT|nr:hypothetical protein SAMN04488057_101154 [Cyclobacterium lianum]